jgi:hypothetical protein
LIERAAAAHLVWLTVTIRDPDGGRRGRGSAWTSCTATGGAFARAALAVETDGAYRNY